MFDEGNVFGSDTVFPDEAPTPAVPPPPARLPAAPAAAPMNGAPSPDGIGAFVRPLPDMPRQAPMEIFPMTGAGPMAGPWDAIEPEDTSSGAAAKSAGFTALFVTVSLGLGIAIGGGWGAGAGVLLAGAVANGYRAQKWWGSPEPSEKHEAVVSAVFAAFGLGTGAYLGYKAYEAKK